MACLIWDLPLRRSLRLSSLLRVKRSLRPDHHFLWRKLVKSYEQIRRSSTRAAQFTWPERSSTTRNDFICWRYWYKICFQKTTSSDNTCEISEYFPEKKSCCIIFETNNLTHNLNYIKEALPWTTFVSEHLFTNRPFWLILGHFFQKYITYVRTKCQIWTEKGQSWANPDFSKHSGSPPE